MNLSFLTGRAVAVAVALAAAGWVSAASAGPLAGPLAGANALGGDAGRLPVELAHGCHRGVQRDYSGWHFHTRACQRVNTPPPGLYDGPSYRRYYRGPICSYQCRFVGPVKTCRQVCR